MYHAGKARFMGAYIFYLGLRMNFNIQKCANSVRISMYI